MSDLIERLEERRNSRCPSGKNREYVNVTIDIDLLDEAITALSPVSIKTDRVNEILEAKPFQDEVGEILIRLREWVGMHHVNQNPLLKRDIGASIELIEKQAGELGELDAQVAALEAARNEALEYLQREGTPYVNSAIAALEEKT